MDVEIPELDARSRVILRELGKSASMISVDNENTIVDTADCNLDISETASDGPKGFSYPVAVAFSINYIMGTGFLTLPWAFAQTGYLSFFVVILITVASIFAVSMLLESMARADLYRRRRGTVVGGENYGEVEGDEEELDISIAGGISYIKNPIQARTVQLGESRFKDSPPSNGNDSPQEVSNPLSQNGSVMADDEEGDDTGDRHQTCPAKDSTESGDRDASIHSLDAIERNTDLPELDKESVEDDVGLLKVNEKKFEVVEQCAMFLGPAMQFTYIISLSCYLLGALWAYGTVFSNALASNIPIPGIDSYLLYLFLFGFIVVPISCMELEEQILIQVILSGGRVLMVVLMVSTILISTLWGHESDFGDDMTGGAALGAFDFDGIRHLMPIAAFAHIFHHSIPALSEPVIDKTKLPSIFSTTLICCFLAYSAISLSVSLYFGSNTLSSSNLNWVKYGYNSFGFSYFMKRVVATFIVIFPALDVASAFPLNAVTLGNNLFSVAYGKRVHIMAKSKWHKTMFRLMGAIPPLIMAAIVSDLGQITDYTGVTGFGIAFIFPPLLSYYSFVKLTGKGLSVQTIYSNFSTRPEICFGLISLGIFLTIYVPIALSMD